MRPFQRRRLTSAERALAAEVFGEALDAGRVRILAAPVWSRAFVAGPALMVWPRSELPDDFGAAPLALQATFVHELTHIWQAQAGIGLIRAKLRAGDSQASYAYARCDIEGFAGLNIEQQAMVVEHAFLASRGAATPFEPGLYAAASQGWRSV